MTPPLPPIYRDCRRLLLHTEEVVRRFSRYHKYTVGTDLRQQAMVLMRSVHQAVYDKTHQLRHVQALVWRVDDYKLTLQLAIELGAFVHGKAGRAVQSAASANAGAPPGFAAFETAAQLASQIGKQCGGWQKAAEQKGASSAANRAHPAHSAAFSQARAGQPAPKSASASRAQAGAMGQSPGAAGLQPLASPAAHPASLSERTTSYGPDNGPQGVKP